MPTSETTRPKAVMQAVSRWKRSSRTVENSNWPRPRAERAERGGKQPVGLFHGEAGVGDDDGEAEQGQPDGDAGHGEQQLEIGERTLPGKQEIDQQAKYDSGEREGRIHEDAEHVAAREGVCSQAESPAARRG